VEESSPSVNLTIVYWSLLLGAGGRSVAITIEHNPLVTIKGIPILTSAPMQIILEVPDRLAKNEKLHELADRLPEALELTPAETIFYQDDRQTLELLATQSVSRRKPRNPPHACIASPHERTAISQ
jgi:hypothetical protein